MCLSVGVEECVCADWDAEARAEQAAAGEEEGTVSEHAPCACGGTTYDNCHGYNCRCATQAQRDAAKARAASWDSLTAEQKENVWRLWQLL